MRDVLHKAFKAARENLGPGLMLWAFALVLLAAYYGSGTVASWLDEVGHWKQRVGLPFAFVSTALFGGLIPFLIQRTRPAHRHRTPWRDLPFYTGFWGLMGMQVDWFYRLQAGWFGTEITPAVVVKQTLVDQLIYAPLIAVPCIAVAYAWKDRGYSLARLRRDLGWRWLRTDFLPVLIANTMVWLPTVLAIYILPFGLRLPAQNLVECFWCLMLVLLTTPDDDETVDGPLAGAGVE